MLVHTCFYWLLSKSRTKPIFLQTALAKKHDLRNVVTETINLRFDLFCDVGVGFMCGV